MADVGESKSAEACSTLIWACFCENDDIRVSNAVLECFSDLRPGLLMKLICQLENDMKSEGADSEKLKDLVHGNLILVHALCMRSELEEGENIVKSDLNEVIYQYFTSNHPQNVLDQILASEFKVDTLFDCIRTLIRLDSFEKQGISQ